MIARVWPENGRFVAKCLDLRVVSQGDNEAEPLSNLREAVALFIESADPTEVRERLHAEACVHTFDVPVEV